MNQLSSINRIVALLSRFVVEVKGLNAINQYGINYISENILIPIFKIVFDYKNLVNLNNQRQNFEGIDLGDKIKRVAFQITSTANNAKVKHTLKQFINNEHYKIYDSLYIYILTEKENYYEEKNYSEIIEDKLKFSANKNIIDYRNLIKKINEITDYKKIKLIEDLLEQQLTDKKLSQVQNSFNTFNTEIVTSNLLEISFPEKLYVAKLAIDRNEVLKGMQKKKANDREVIFHYKSQNQLRFSADWIDHSKQIYTFHDLGNKNHDLSKIIDAGTIDVIQPEEFYAINQDTLRAFKALLKFCFSKQAFYLGIDFYHDDNIYVFIPEDEENLIRTESWETGKRNISRNVIKVKQNRDNDNPWYFTNLAFSILFRFYDDRWFLEINPEWYITKDGKQKHYWMHEDVVSFLKRKERNQHVFNHVRFIGNYFKYGKSQLDLFGEATFKPKNFIEFKKFLKFENAPNLHEKGWMLSENEDDIKEMKDEDGLLEFENET